jgi:hypothetical protein
VTKDQRKTVTCGNILNQTYTKHWTLLSIKIRQYISLMKYITMQQLTKGTMLIFSKGVFIVLLK